MTFRPLKSSLLAGATYDADMQTLSVRLNGGREYTYYGVPQRAVDGLYDAKSPGKYFGDSIKAKYSTKPPRARNAR